jgi:hypothetical protein
LACVEDFGIDRGGKEKNGLGRKMPAREAPGQTAKGQARWSSLLGEEGGACLIDGDETTRSPAQIMHSVRPHHSRLDLQLLALVLHPRAHVRRALDEHDQLRMGFEGTKSLRSAMGPDHTQNDARTLDARGTRQQPAASSPWPPP